MPMRIKDADFENISPWMRKYVREGAELFVKFPKNHSRYYGVLFISALVATFVLSWEVFDLSQSGGDGGIILLFSPFVAFYALVLFLWCRYGKTEIALSDTIAKTMKFANIGIGWNHWQWSEIHGIWVQDENAGVPKENDEYQGTIYLRYNNGRQAILSNLTLSETENLKHAIAHRLALRRCA